MASKIKNIIIAVIAIVAVILFVIKGFGAATHKVDVSSILGVPFCVILGVGVLFLVFRYGAQVLGWLLGIALAIFVGYFVVQFALYLCSVSSFLAILIIGGAIVLGVCWVVGLLCKD